MKTCLNPGSLTVLLVAVSLGLPAVAQSTSDQQPQVQTGASTNAQAQAQTANPQTGTGKAPLAEKSNEGFWGKMNPFARKKWVEPAAGPGEGSPERAGSAPGQERGDIKDVDQRAQNGIHAAQSTADQANQAATTANQTAIRRSRPHSRPAIKTAQLGETVSNLDQYHSDQQHRDPLPSGPDHAEREGEGRAGSGCEPAAGPEGLHRRSAGYSRTRGAGGHREFAAHGGSGRPVSGRNSRFRSIAFTKSRWATRRSARITVPNAKPGSVVRVSLMQNSLAALNSALQRRFTDWCDAAVFRAALPSGCCVAANGSASAIRQGRNKLSHNERTKADWPLTRGALFLVFAAVHLIT